MTTRGPNNIFSGEPRPLIPDVKDPEMAAYLRNLDDYLRRLTGKLGRFTGPTGGTSSGAIKSLATYAGFQAASAPFDISWNASLWQDDNFDFLGPDTEITVLEAGFYVVEVDWRIAKNFSDHQLHTNINGSTQTYMESFVPDPITGGTYSYMIPVVLAVNDIITINISSSSDVGCEDGTRLLISKLGASA